jgi:formylglycine-generating enzyme required for sulfatase activity
VGGAADGEGPVRQVTLRPAWIDTRAATNARFHAFVEATGYRTDAAQYGWSFVFAGQLPEDFPETRAVAAAPWWRQVMGADWRHPEGPRSGQARVTRGGSYLCHASYCNRYRVAARSSNTPDSSTGHTGFRCARDA